MKTFTATITAIGERAIILREDGEPTREGFTGTSEECITWITGRHSLLAGRPRRLPRSLEDAQAAWARSGFAEEWELRIDEAEAPGVDARRAYKLNHSDLRALGRFAKTEQERLEKIAQGCRDRRFWLSDPRCSAGGIAALRVLNGDLGTDPLALRVELHRLYSGMCERAPYIRMRHFFGERRESIHPYP